MWKPNYFADPKCAKAAALNSGARRRDEHESRPRRASACDVCMLLYCTVQAQVFGFCLRIASKTTQKLYKRTLKSIPVNFSFSLVHIIATSF